MQEEAGFWYILIFASVISWVLVRWKKGLFALAAPLVALLSWFACSRLVYDLSENESRYWFRGFPDYYYIMLGVAAAVIPVLSCGLAFFLPRKGANQALLPTPMSITDRADARSAPATGAADL